MLLNNSDAFRIYFTSKIVTRREFIRLIIIGNWLSFLSFCFVWTNLNGTDLFPFKISLFSRFKEIQHSQDFNLIIFLYSYLRYFHLPISLNVLNDNNGQVIIV